MSRKAKIKFEYRCILCDSLQLTDKDKGNENWSVYPSTCSKCGGKVNMILKGTDK